MRVRLNQSEESRRGLADETDQYHEVVDANSTRRKPRSSGDGSRTRRSDDRDRHRRRALRECPAITNREITDAVQTEQRPVP